ncbi:hypothetical protein YTPLAS18_33100 [Nitrospira sp.]|nr:hypothetical protein YTPLAS18_33100 [Nitrospira sp.]
MWVNALSRYLVVSLACACFLSSILVVTSDAVSARPSVPTEEEELLDINTATEEQLKALPGIGDAYAKEVIKGRPYARKDELVLKRILPRAIYEQIKYKIVAMQQ